MECGSTGITPGAGSSLVLVASSIFRNLCTASNTFAIALNYVQSNRVPSSHCHCKKLGSLEREIELQQK